MTKTTTTVEDPDLVTSKNVDGNGRVYLGTEYADGKVRVVVERVAAGIKRLHEPR